MGIDSRLILDVAVFGRGGPVPVAFVYRLTEKYDLSERVFLADGYGYLTDLSIQAERSARLRRSKPHRGVVSHV